MEQGRVAIITEWWDSVKEKYEWIFISIAE